MDVESVLARRILQLANQILHYFRVRKDHQASTDSVLSFFKGWK